METPVTSQEVWQSTLIFAFTGGLLFVPLILLSKEVEYLRPGAPIGLGSAVFWGVLSIAAITGFWELYYRYIYPEWARNLAPLNFLLYAAIGLGMAWLAFRLPLPGSPLVWFLVLGGLEGIGEHLLGIYGLDILRKVPFLQGLSPFPVIVFSFFEYIVYWVAVAWIAYLLAKIPPLAQWSLRLVR